MKVNIEPGKYIVAVSGGVDSVALLHRLQGLPDVELVVAHFDHGIRKNSTLDRLLVQGLAEEYGIPFEYEEGRLGSDASEAKARKARYEFLRRVQKDKKADAVVTAHHQDDVLETAIINILRGTGRKGLSSLASGDDIRRPMLHLSKRQIINYAKDQRLNWREDSTNQNEVYLRNYVRRQILPRFSQSERKQFLKILGNTAQTNQELDTLLAKELRKYGLNGEMDREWFNKLDHGVAKEVIAAWLRSYGIRDFDSKTLERLAVAAKTAQPGNSFDILRSWSMRVNKNNLALSNKER